MGLHTSIPPGERYQCHPGNDSGNTDPKSGERRPATDSAYLLPEGTTMKVVVCVVDQIVREWSWLRAIASDMYALVLT